MDIFFKYLALLVVGFAQGMLLSLFGVPSTIVIICGGCLGFFWHGIWEQIERYVCSMKK